MPSFNSSSTISTFSKLKTRTTYIDTHLAYHEH